MLPWDIRSIDHIGCNAMDMRIWHYAFRIHECLESAVFAPAKILKANLNNPVICSAKPSSLSIKNNNCHKFGKVLILSDLFLDLTVLNSLGFTYL